MVGRTSLQPSHRLREGEVPAHLCAKGCGQGVLPPWCPSQSQRLKSSPPAQAEGIQGPRAHHRHPQNEQPSAFPLPSSCGELSPSPASPRPPCCAPPCPSDEGEENRACDKQLCTLPKPPALAGAVQGLVATLRGRNHEGGNKCGEGGSREGSGGAACGGHGCQAGGTQQKREREEGAESDSGEPNTRDILCVPQDLRQRGVAVIRPGEGRKLAGLGGERRHTQRDAEAAAACGVVRGQVILFQGSRDRQRNEGLRRAREEVGGLVWELGLCPRSGPPGSLGLQGRSEDGATGRHGSTGPTRGEMFPGLFAGSKLSGCPITQAGGTCPTPAMLVPAQG